MSLAAIRRRLTKLEQAAGISDSPVCTCAKDKVDVRAYTGPDSKADAERDARPARLCERCHKPLRIIQIVVVRVPRKMTPDEWRTSVEGRV